MCQTEMLRALLTDQLTTFDLSALSTVRAKARGHGTSLAL